MISELPVHVDEISVMVIGGPETIDLKLETGASGDRGAIFFAGPSLPPVVPPTPTWGNINEFRIGDLWMDTTASGTGKLYNYQNQPGGPVWVYVFEMRP